MTEAENRVKESKTNDVIQHEYHMLTLYSTYSCLE